MYTLGGQTFAKAWSNIAQAIIKNPTIKLTNIPNQPFLEAFGVANGLCATGNCTQFFLNDFGRGGFPAFSFTDFWETYANGGPDANQVLDSYIIGSNGRSNYNAGFVSLHKTTSAGLNLTFNYTYSHAFDQIGQNQESLNEASDAFNLDRDYGSAQFDRRHAITTLVTYDLPFGGAKRYSAPIRMGHTIIRARHGSLVWTCTTEIPP